MTLIILHAMIVKKRIMIQSLLEVQMFLFLILGEIKKLCRNCIENLQNVVFMFGMTRIVCIKDWTLCTK